MPLSPAWTEDLRAADLAMRNRGSAARAKAEAAYLKSSLTFYGCGLPVIREVARDLARKHPGAPRGEVVAAVRWLFVGRIHERWTLGTVLLERSTKLLDQRDLSLLERLIRQTAWWNFVDALAANVASAIVRAEPNAIKTVRRWGRDDDFWVRRSAILALIDGVRAGELPFAWLANVIEPLLPEKEFFIRKAIGWALREVGKSRPNDVEAFLIHKLETISPLSIREAVKYLPPATARRLLADLGRTHSRAS